VAWFEYPYRRTRDLDLLGFGDSSSEAMLTIWKDICETAFDDGIKFDGGALLADPIREQLEYGGLRLRTTAALASARIPITVDIGFGDAVEPDVEEVSLAGSRLAVENSRFLSADSILPQDLAFTGIFQWRRGRDSNPRWAFDPPEGS
jgi:hypothetical protein